LVNNELLKWVQAAGIKKKITFHCARHTFATLQLTVGTDLYTLSKLLGHTDIKTTQIYANIIDEKKREAVNRIPDINI
jgi:site-specific recombinase XerD